MDHIGKMSNVVQVTEGMYEISKVLKCCLILLGNCYFGSRKLRIETKGCVHIGSILFIFKNLG
jgi:hypothetical protein